MRIVLTTRTNRIAIGNIVWRTSGMKLQCIAIMPHTAFVQPNAIGVTFISNQVANFAYQLSRVTIQRKRHCMPIAFAIHANFETHGIDRLRIFVGTIKGGMCRVRIFARCCKCWQFKCCGIRLVAAKNREILIQIFRILNKHAAIQGAGHSRRLHNRRTALRTLVIRR